MDRERQMLGDREQRLMLTSAFANRPRGFTLIELMTALAIFGVAITLSAPSMSVWMQNSQVRTVAESIQDGLQIARNEAVRRNRLVAFTVDSDTGWTVTDKVLDPKKNVMVDEIVQQRVHQEGSSGKVTATITGSATAAFDGLGQVSNADPLTAVDIASSIDGSKAMRVELAKSGQIRLCDPKVANSIDPRKCQRGTTP
jgi:type IV fimbrial biogenesis protein FimT